MVGVAVSAVILCTQLNYQHSPGCQPVEFHQTLNGWEGTLKNGEKFTQEYVTRDMMLFETESKGLRYLVYKSHVVYLD